MIDWVAVSISIIAVGFTILIWLESRKQSQLLQVMLKGLPYVQRTRRKKPDQAKATHPASSMPKMSTSAAEERRRLKLELEKEKLQWQKNKDIAKGIAWFIDRLGESDEEYEDE